MTLTERLAKFKDGASDIIAVVYENYRAVGTIPDVKRAVANYGKTTGVDLMSLEIELDKPGNSYGDDPDTTEIRLQKAATPSEEVTP